MKQINNPLKKSLWFRKENNIFLKRNHTHLWQVSASSFSICFVNILRKTQKLLLSIWILRWKNEKKKKKMIYRSHFVYVFKKGQKWCEIECIFLLWTLLVYCASAVLLHCSLSSAGCMHEIVLCFWFKCKCKWHTAPYAKCYIYVWKWNRFIVEQFDWLRDALLKQLCIRLIYFLLFLFEGRTKS